MNPNNCDQLVIASGKNNDFTEFSPFCIQLNKATMMYEPDDSVDLEKWHKEISSENGGRYSKGKGQSAEDLLKLVEVGEVVPKDQLEARAKEFGITQRGFRMMFAQLVEQRAFYVHEERRFGARPRLLVSQTRPDEEDEPELIEE
jgi:hypothetical protein